MKTRLYALLFCLSALFPSAPLFAAWSSVSSTPTSWLVAGSGSSLFAADSSSVYASSDSGKTWASVTNPGGSPFSALAFFNGQLWVGTTSQGATFSSNSGSAWTKSAIGTLNPFSKVYTYSQINDIAPAYGSTANLVAATALGGFISSDSGGNWSSTSQGLPVSGTCPFCTKLPVHTLVGTSGGILAGTDTGIYRSNDNGANWSAVGLSTTMVSKLTVGGSDIYALAGGSLYKSTDSGTTWSQLTGLSAVPTAVLAHPGKAGVVFAGTAQGKVFTSTDSGATWTDISDTTLPSTQINALAVAPDQANSLMAATGSGIFSYTSTVPPKFSFVIPPVTGAPLNITIVSKEVTIIGLTKAEPISIVGGKYSLNGRPFTDQPGLVANGARLRVQLQSSSSPKTSATATVTINGVSAAFVVTTIEITRPTDLTQVFTTPPAGAVINPDGTVSVTSTTPVALQPTLPAGIVINTGVGTPLTHSGGTLTFTPQATGATLNSVSLNLTSTGLQVASGTFNVQSTAGNTIPLGNSTTTAGTTTTPATLTTSGTCPTTMSVQNSGTQTSTFVQNCIVRFTPSGTVAAASGFSATATGTDVYGGETAEVSSGGSLDRIRIGSLVGDQGLPGDPLTLANVTSDSTIPKLDGNLQRPSTTGTVTLTLLTVIQEALNSKFGVTTSQITYDSANGVVTYTAGGKVYRFIPIDVPTVQISGSVASANRFAAANPASSASGAFSLASQGISVTLASTLGYFTDLDTSLKSFDPASKIRLRSSGALQLTVNGADYVCAPGSNAASSTTTGAAPAFQLDNNGVITFQDSHGTTQVLYPTFADISTADATVKAVDASASVVDNGNGTTTMNLLGGSYTLKPELLLIPLPSDHTNDLWWPDGAKIYLRYPDNTAQSVSL